MLTCLWKNMLTKITTHLEKQYNKKLAQKFYKSTDQYYGFYTHFLLLHVGFQKSGKDDHKKTINLLHSFTRTRVLDRSSTIEGVNVIAITITKTHQYSLMKTNL